MYVCPTLFILSLSLSVCMCIFVLLSDYLRIIARIKNYEINCSYHEKLTVLVLALKQTAHNRKDCGFD